MSKPPPTLFSGKRMRQARESAKMSRFQLAQAIGFVVRPNTLATYEDGTYVPTLDTAILIARALDIPLRNLTDAKS